MSSGYEKYSREAKDRMKVSPLNGGYPPLPCGRYDVIYADPPWDYGGKLQFDRSSKSSENVGWKNDIFISGAGFKYPTMPLEELKRLPVVTIAADDSLLFMWATGPHMENAVALGNAWGFDYKTVAFVWDKQVHNPGRYTLSQTEFVLVFKRGRFPQPRGARNVRQMVSAPRGRHSEKPEEVIAGITAMFPTQRKIELFARRAYDGWNNWGLEVPGESVPIRSAKDVRREERQPSLFSFGVEMTTGGMPLSSLL